LYEPVFAAQTVTPAQAVSFQVPTDGLAADALHTANLTPEHVGWSTTGLQVFADMIGAQVNLLGLQGIVSVTVAVLVMVVDLVTVGRTTGRVMVLVNTVSVSVVTSWTVSVSVVTS